MVSFRAGLQPMAMKSAALRVLYFTIVDIGRVDNGGGLVCRNHAARIAETPERFTHDLQRRAFHATERQRSLCATDRRRLPFLELDQDARQPEIRRRPSCLSAKAAAQTRVHRDVEKVIDEVRPDTVVVDYLFSALYAPAIYRRRDVRRITITLNNESRFFRELLASAGAEPSFKKIARLWRYEQSIYARSHVVVANNRLDVAPFPWLKRVVIAPIFERSANSWHGGNGDLFFVGNANHFPNRQAIEWLCFKFAPELAKQSTARIVSWARTPKPFRRACQAMSICLELRPGPLSRNCTKGAGCSWLRSPTATAARSSCCNVCHWVRRSWRRAMR